MLCPLLGLSCRKTKGYLDTTIERPTYFSARNCIFGILLVFKEVYHYESNAEINVYAGICRAA